jgi:uncharacterized protein (TIGR00255 family)
MADDIFKVKSMTGYGRAAAETAGLRVEAEVKGVNHRFLDVKLRLPGEFAALEQEIRGRVQARVGRGRIEISVSAVSTRAAGFRIEVRRELVAGYLEAATAIKKEFRLRGSIGIDQAMSLPGAVSIQQEAVAADGTASTTLLAVVDQALLAYEAMRTAEGVRLAKDLAARLGEIAAETAQIETEARGLPETYAARLRERVAALVADRGLDDIRLAQEVALLADRVDTSEELVRLAGYVEQARSTLEGAAGPVGKTLDFVMQEMNREANTISSKAESLAICQAALRIKSAVEKIREQVQNLE